MLDEDISAPRGTLEFVLNGERVSLSGIDVTRTLLTWLREERGLVGTKEGCAEGDCGACTVAVVERGPDGMLHHAPLNACILCIGALDGREVVTVEGLKGSALHPVQQAMVDCHGSQCGFCTPGFVMALYAHGKAGGDSSRAALCDALAGNLCRCTGYRPILDAGERAAALPESEHDQLALLPRDSTLIEAPGRRFFVPVTVSELAGFLGVYPDATILAGGTDVGLWLTKAHRDLANVVYIGRIDEMRTVRIDGDAYLIGGAATYRDAGEALAAIHRDIGELLRRLGSPQIRAAGTVAGNVANGSPIGDSMPVLLALGATLVLQRGDAVRELALDDFYLGYRKNALARGEFIRAVRVPKLPANARFAAYKLSKRFDQDISSVCAAFRVDADGRARFGFGGMAATPARAKRAEAAWPGGVEAACAALAEDFQPLSDHRASAWYRLTAAQNLLRKFALECEGVRVRVLEVAP
jgi:xanthine dehydrogenase small subunit